MSWLSVIGFLGSIASLALHAWQWWNARKDKKAGADAQSARDTAKALKAETAIAQAEADAPKSDSEVDQRLKDHTL